MNIILEFLSIFILIYELDEKETPKSGQNKLWVYKMIIYLIFNYKHVQVSVQMEDF